MLDEIIVVRRQTQTVRAVESRTGAERWNFSVGHHELEVLKPENCHAHAFSELDTELLDLQLKVIVPEGIVCAVKKGAPNVVIWKHKVGLEDRNRIRIVGQTDNFFYSLHFSLIIRL